MRKRRREKYAGVATVVGVRLVEMRKDSATYEVRLECQLTVDHEGMQAMPINSTVPVLVIPEEP